MKASLSRLGYAAVAAVGLAPRVAAAQDPAAKAQAVQLFDAADKLMTQGNISEACPKYAASMKLDPQLGALLHLADCYAKNDQLASAWGSFREAEEMAHLKNDDRASFAKEQASQLEPRLSRITVVVPDTAMVQGLEVSVDGSPIISGAWGAPTPINSGSHAVEARAPRHETWSSSVVVAGEAKDVKVEIPALIASAPGQARSSGPAPETTTPVDVAPVAPSKVSTLRIVGLTAGGVGIVALGASGYFALRASSLNKKSKTEGCNSNSVCSDAGYERRNDAIRASNVATITIIAGGILTATGATLFLIGNRNAARERAAFVQVTPAAGPDFSGMLVRGQF